MMKVMTLEEKTALAQDYETARRHVKVKVWNDDGYPYQQPFEEKLIFIPARSFIMMPYNEAKRFKFSDPMPGKNRSNPDRLKVVDKVIRVEEPTHEEVLKQMQGIVKDTNNFFSYQEDPIPDGARLIEEKPSDQPIRTGYVCTICSKSFNKPGQLGRHLMTAHKE